MQWGGGFSAEDAALVRSILSEYLRARRLAGSGVHAKVVALEQKLAIMSAVGPDVEYGSARLDAAELIPTSEAAVILGCSPRHVRRLADVLDGERVGGRLVFQRDVVTRYLEERAR